MATAKLTAEVSTKGASKAEKELKGLSTQAGKTSKNVNKLENSLKSVGRNASAAVASINGPLGAVSGRIASLTTVLTSGTAVATGFGVAIAGVGAAMFQGTQNIDDYNVNLARTEALLKATGNAAGISAQELQDQAAELALATLTSTKEVQAAQAQLLTFNRVTRDVFTEAIELSQDLAETGFGSITSNAVQLGKALQDPITGMSALTRVGISFNSTQKETIQLLQEGGDVAGAQQVILAALQEQVGGAGAAVASDSLAGKFDTAGQKWEEFTIALASETGTVTATGDAVDWLSSSLQSMTDLITGGTTENQLDTITTSMDGQQKAIDALNDKLLRYSDEQRKALGSGQALAAFETQRKGIVDQLTVAQGLYNDSLSEQDDLIAALADKEQAAADARAAGIAKQKSLDDADAAARIVKQDEILAKEAESEAKRVQATQDRIDKQVETIRTGLLSEEEALLQSTLNQAELISNSTLSEQEQAALRLEVWDNYYTQLSDKNKAANDAITADNERNAKLNEVIANQQQAAQLTALDNTTSSLKSTLGEQSSIYKAAAITQATIDTYTAANGAYAALASIPYVGPALGAAAAGVAIGAGLANVSAITSARHTGGDLAAGQQSTIAEQGEIEVIAPSSNSRVRTKQQMMQLMGGAAGGQQANVNLTVIDQSSGNKTFTEENGDDGSTILLIRDTVAGDLQNNTSQIAKARKTTSGQPGF
jgi:hypothetical protein